MIINHKDPASMYEDIVRFAFKCGKYEDPLGLAKQETYVHNIEPIGFRLKLGLSYALFKVGRDLGSERLQVLSEQVWSSSEQRSIIDIMDETVDMINENLSR